MLEKKKADEKRLEEEKAAKLAAKGLNDSEEDDVL